VPGADGSTSLWSLNKPLAIDTFELRAPVADRVFCSIDHARERGWPWLKTQAPTTRARRCA